MSQEIIFDKNVLVQKFLLPISKLADNVSLIPKENLLYAVCATQDGNIVLLATLKTNTNLKDIPRLNLPDVKKFVRLLDCIEDNELKIRIENNHIKYETPQFKFNYFLLEDSYIQKCPVNPDKINQLTYDSEFILSGTKFNEVLRGSSIATDSDKVYFYTKDDNVYAELNDFERQNINNITYLIADSFTGEPIKNTLPLNLENIRLLAGLRVDQFKIKVNNNLKVTLFESKDNDVCVKFIISALVK
jgi:DNA polymerase III sliding clamp (beta) subunit (PCNA family)